GLRCGRPGEHAGRRRRGALAPQPPSGVAAVPARSPAALPCCDRRKRTAGREKPAVREPGFPPEAAVDRTQLPGTFPRVPAGGLDKPPLPQEGCPPSGGTTRPRRPHMESRTTASPPVGPSADGAARAWIQSSARALSPVTGAVTRTSAGLAALP